MELIIPTGCDNAPRKQIVIDFTVALWRKQSSIIDQYADESILLLQMKHGKVEGKSALHSHLQEHNKEPIQSLEIYQVITHGKFASINGLITLSNSHTIDFCDVYTFSNAAKTGKVKEIKSYCI